LIFCVTTRKKTIHHCYAKSKYKSAGGGGRVIRCVLTGLADVRARRREAADLPPSGATNPVRPRFVGEAVKHPDGFILGRHEGNKSKAEIAKAAR